MLCVGSEDSNGMTPAYLACLSGLASLSITMLQHSAINVKQGKVWAVTATLSYLCTNVDLCVGIGS